MACIPVAATVTAGAAKRHLVVATAPSPPSHLLLLLLVVMQLLLLLLNHHQLLLLLLLLSIVNVMRHNVGVNTTIYFSSQLLVIWITVQMIVRLGKRQLLLLLLK